MADVESGADDEVRREENRQRIRVMKRRGTLVAARDYITFWGSMIVGIPTLIIGGIEYIEPTAMDLVQNGRLVGAIGLSLVAGPKVIQQFVLLAKSVQDV